MRADILPIIEEVFECPFCGGKLYLIDCYKLFYDGNDLREDILYIIMSEVETLTDNHCFRAFDIRFNCKRPCFYYCVKRGIINLEGNCGAYEIIEGLKEGFFREEGFSDLLHRGFTI